MNELLTKILILILGFLLGTTGNIIVNLNKDKRKKAAIVDLIRAEIEAFICACENAAQRKFWDSWTVEHLAKHITQSYSQDRDRFISVSRSKSRMEIYNFYLEVGALLSLIECHRKQKKGTGGSSAAIGPGTYEGIIERSKKVLKSL
ncbi:MAG: hypothetical protein SRB1_02996 [Desulfobacteraceae bacterium Eth-SRB1]|nr:MAG: hypothetical protein SRB1_02996 [Desulfobacteraceae bacterium Eth-SRB1]